MARIPYELWVKLKGLAQEHRHDPTPAEELVWEQLRSRELIGTKFRRQHPVYRFILDFASLRPKLAVEIDGEIHETAAEYDNIRTEYLNYMGFTVIRFTNDDVFNDLEDVLNVIEAKIVEKLRASRRNINP